MDGKISTREHAVAAERMKREQISTELGLRLDHAATNLRRDIRAMRSEFRSWLLAMIIGSSVAFVSRTVIMYNVLRL